MNRCIFLFLCCMMHELLEAQCSFIIKSDTTLRTGLLYNSVVENSEGEICILEHSFTNYLSKFDQCGNSIAKSIVMDTFQELLLSINSGYKEVGLRFKENNFDMFCTDQNKHYLINSDYNLVFNSVIEMDNSISNIYFLNDELFCTFPLNGLEYQIYNTKGELLSQGSLPTILPLNVIKFNMDKDSSIYVLTEDYPRSRFLKFEKNFKSLVWEYKDTCDGAYFRDFIIKDNELILVGNSCMNPNEYEPYIWIMDKQGVVKTTKSLKAGVKFNQPMINKITWSEEGFYYAVGSRSYKVRERTQFFFTKLSRDFDVIWDIDYKAVSVNEHFASDATRLIPAKQGGFLCTGFNSVVRYDSLNGRKSIIESYLMKVSSDGKITSLGDKLKSDPKQKVIEQYNSDHLILNNDLMFKRYRMINYAGQEIQSGVVRDVIDISRFHSGYYYIQVIDEQYRVVGAEGFVVE